MWQTWKYATQMPISCGNLGNLFTNPCSISLSVKQDLSSDRQNKGQKQQEPKEAEEIKKRRQEHTEELYKKWGYLISRFNIYKVFRECMLLSHFSRV